MSNIPGATNILPSVVTNIQTQSLGASVPGGLRIASIIGEGSRSEIIVTNAVGGGNDGLNPTYTSVNGADGRHFALTQSPIISNRTTLFRNGLPLIGLEGSITATFSYTYDYMIDIATGHIELQSAHLVDVGGTFYLTGGNNVGLGSIQALQLLDANAPSENWTIKCISVARGVGNVPLAGTARFVAFGSVSGNLLDANGNSIVWVADGYAASNGVLSFSILETGYAAGSPATATSPFVPGDSFTVTVSSGVLLKNDSLTATYIAVGDINSPVFFDNVQDIKTKHGAVSLSNTLSLGCQLAFANNPPGIMCVQAAPGIPRRTSYILDTSVPALSLNVEDFIYPLPPGVIPDLNSEIHFFVTSPSTLVETQLLPNKFPYYTLGLAGQPTTTNFVFSNTNPPGGNTYSYSVISQYSSVITAQDGYITLDPNHDVAPYSQGIFSSASVTFTSSYVGKVLNIIDSNDVANVGEWVVNGVVNGDLYVQLLQPLSLTNDPPMVPAPLSTATVFPDFVDNSALPPGQTQHEVSLFTFELIDPVTGLLVPGSAGTNGTITASVGTGTATITDTVISFTTLGGNSIVTNGYLLKVSGSFYDNGTYIVTAYTSGGNGTLTIAKAVATDFDMRYEILDTTVAAANFVVVNHNIVPNLNQLRVTIVDSRDAAFFDAGWESALASLETQEIDILVCLPLSTISAIFENAENHCLTMSNIRNRKERVLFLGAINGLTPANLTGASLAAVENLGVLEGIQGNTVAEILAGDTEDLANYSVSAAYGETFRAVYFFPDQIVVQVGSDNQILSGFYIAAAAAGYLSGVPNVGVPLTNKVLSGFTIETNRTFNETTLEGLASAGVCILAPVAGGGLVLWGLTTTQSGFPEEQEISIVFIRDRIAKSLRAGFQGFIGIQQTNDTLATLTSRAIALLNGFISQTLITNWKNLTVVVDSVDPRQIDISVSVQPSYPLNWVYISVGVGLLT